jgi:hypothetical protein
MEHETEPAPATPPLHLRPNPRQRTQFRNLSISILALTSLVPFISIASAFHAYRARAERVIDTWISKGKQDSDRVDECGRMRRDVAGEGETERAPERARTVPARTGEHIMSFARAAHGIGDAYDLSTCAWRARASVLRGPGPEPRHREPM